MLAYRNAFHKGSATVFRSDAVTAGTLDTHTHTHIHTRIKCVSAKRSACTCLSYETHRISISKDTCTRTRTHPHVVDTQNPAPNVTHRQHTSASIALGSVQRRLKVNLHQTTTTTTTDAPSAAAARLLAAACERHSRARNVCTRGRRDVPTTNDIDEYYQRNQRDCSAIRMLAHRATTCDEIIFNGENQCIRILVGFTWVCVLAQ